MHRIRKPNGQRARQASPSPVSNSIDFARFRVIDLSMEILPGEKKTDGRYFHGKPLHGRPCEVEEIIAYTARMHFIRSETHMGTHLEAPYKYFEDGKDVGSLPVESLMGEAAACNFSSKNPGEAIRIEDFRRAGVKRGDILLMWARRFDPPVQKSNGDGAVATNGNATFSDEDLRQWPYLEPKAMNWLIETKIKMLAMENILLSPCGTAYGEGYGDWKLCKAGIPIVDCVVGLDQITKPRVFFMALPVKMRRVSASWCRALALEAR